MTIEPNIPRLELDALILDAFMARLAARGGLDESEQLDERFALGDDGGLHCYLVAPDTAIFDAVLVAWHRVCPSVVINAVASPVLPFLDLSVTAIVRRTTLC